MSNLYYIRYFHSPYIFITPGTCKEALVRIDVRVNIWVRYRPLHTFYPHMTSPNLQSWQVLLSSSSVKLHNFFHRWARIDSGGRKRPIFADARFPHIIDCANFRKFTILSHQLPTPLMLMFLRRIVMICARRIRLWAIWTLKSDNIFKIWCWHRESPGETRRICIFDFYIGCITDCMLCW